MLPTRHRVVFTLQQSLGPNDVLLFFLKKLAKRIENAAARGKAKVEFFVPCSLLGFPSYNREYVLQQILEQLRVSGYDNVARKGDWHIEIDFNLKPHERVFFSVPVKRDHVMW